MEVPLISEQSLTFSKWELAREGWNLDFSIRRAPASLEKLPNFGIGMKICEERSDRSSSDPPTEGGPGKLNNVGDKSITVQIIKCNPPDETKGCLAVWTTKSDVDYFWQLEEASGGQQRLDIKFKLGTTENYEINIETYGEMFSRFDWGVPGPTDLTFLLAKCFVFTDSLSEAWRDNGSTFIGKLSVNMRLSDDHLGGILRFGEVHNSLVAVTKRMQMDTKFTDATLVSGNGEEIKCHKIVLIALANSDVFKTMFETKMKEGLTGTVDIPDMSFEGVQALLDYFYCQDTTKASTSASVALELLMKADEYSIESLEKAMLQLIHVKDKDWLSVDVALRLFQFARNKFENEGLVFYNLIMQKVALVLKSKSKKEVVECPEFKGFFKNAENGAELCTYLIFGV